MCAHTPHTASAHTQMHTHFYLVIICFLFQFAIIIWNVLFNFGANTPTEETMIGQDTDKDTQADVYKV